MKNDKAAVAVHPGLEWKASSDMEKRDALCIIVGGEIFQK